MQYLGSQKSLITQSKKNHIIGKLLKLLCPFAKHSILGLIRIPLHVFSLSSFSFALITTRLLLSFPSLLFPSIYTLSSSSSSASRVPIHIFCIFHSFFTLITASASSPSSFLSPCLPPYLSYLLSFLFSFLFLFLVVSLFFSQVFPPFYIFLVVVILFFFLLPFLPSPSFFCTVFPLSPVFSILYYLFIPSFSSPSSYFSSFLTFDLIPSSPFFLLPLFPLSSLSFFLSPRHL